MLIRKKMEKLEVESKEAAEAFSMVPQEILKQIAEWVATPGMPKQKP